MFASEDPRALLRHYRQVELLAGAGSWLLDPLTKRIWWSAGAQRIRGLPAEDAEQTASVFVETIVDDDRTTALKDLDEFLTGNGSTMARFRIRLPDGRARHVLTYGESFFPGEGRPALVRGYILDVTERHEELRRERERVVAEGDERFREAMASAPLPAMLHAEDGAVLLVNRRWEELSGYAPEELSTVRDWARLAYPSKSDVVLSGIARLFELSEAVDEGEFEIVAKDGTRRVWLFSSAPAGSLADGRRVVVSMAHDLTAERQLAREHREYEERVRRAQLAESLGVLAGGIAHDFNNVLMGALSGVTEALELTEGNDAVATILGDVNRALERAAALSHDMLTYAGQREPERTTVGVDVALEKMKGLLRVAVPRQHGLSYELGADDAPIHLGESGLHRVVMNLAINAAEALGTHGGHIVVRTGRETLDREQLNARYLGASANVGEHAYVEVEDDGPGIDGEVAARMFEPFFSTKGDKRGLGMAIVLGIARTAGGTVELRTAANAGTTIRVSLPIGDAAVATAPTSTRPPPPRESTNQGRPVLVVDDEPLVLHAIAGMLRREGFAVAAAGDGHEAIALHEQNGELAVAIVDLSMPGMNGLELMRRLKAQQPTLPVLLTTGFADDVLSERGGPPPDGLLIKPFRSRRLLESLRQVLPHDAE